MCFDTTDTRGSGKTTRRLLDNCSARYVTFGDNTVAGRDGAAGTHADLVSAVKMQTSAVSLSSTRTKKMTRNVCECNKEKEREGERESENNVLLQAKSIFPRWIKVIKSSISMHSAYSYFF